MEVISTHICQSLSLFLLMFYVFLHHRVDGRSLPLRDLEIERYLKKMKKPAVKTIKSHYGDVIDCVDIYKQPSLDHPLLRNHTIQMKPSFNPSSSNDENLRMKNFKLGVLMENACPKGTVPITRIRKSDILKSSSLESFGKKSPRNCHPAVQGNQPSATANGHEHSTVYQLGGPYFGVAADINLWNPRVEPNDFSIAQIWVISDQKLQNTVEAGVMVFPLLYSDNKTRLFIYWTADAYGNSGCYNLLCPGFVQTSHEIALGAILTPLSTYDGDQYQVPIKIFKDNNKDGNWWLTVLGKVLGYWPSTLVPALEEGSKFVQWGGEVLNSNFKQGSTTTQMGSGHFSSEGHKRAAYFKNIRTFDANGNFQDPIGSQTIIENPKCYDLQFDGTSNFYYGGPGKNADCP